jgi:hypothetical protein
MFKHRLREILCRGSPSCDFLLERHLRAISFVCDFAWLMVANWKGLEDLFFYRRFWVLNLCLCYELRSKKTPEKKCCRAASNTATSLFNAVQTCDMVLKFVLLSLRKSVTLALERLTFRGCWCLWAEVIWMLFTSFWLRDIAYVRFHFWASPSRDFTFDHRHHAILGYRRCGVVCGLWPLGWNVSPSGGVGKVNQRRRSEGDECEPIKIPQRNSTYVPNWPNTPLF